MSSRGSARDAYTGAIGYAAPGRRLELNVAIRTFELRRDRLWLQAGAGIVADSDPAAEAAECAVKAAPLLAAVGAPGDVAAGVRSPLAVRPAARHPRPDPRHGVFETLLAHDGTIEAIEEHIARLAHSLAQLYGAAMPAGVEAALRAAAPPRGRARLRVTADGSGWSLDVGSAPPHGVAVGLEPVVVPGGLGAHKWADRRLLEAFEPAGNAVALIVDGDEAVLEASRANLFARRGEVLLTPPADGRILPGVTRARVIETARALGVEVREERIELGALATLDEVFLTGSLRGIEPVDGPAGELAGRIAEALGRGTGIVAR